MHAYGPCMAPMQSGGDVWRRPVMQCLTSSSALIAAGGAAASACSMELSKSTEPLFASLLLFCRAQDALLAERRSPQQRVSLTQGLIDFVTFVVITLPSSRWPGLGPYLSACILRYFGPYKSTAVRRYDHNSMHFYSRLAQDNIAVLLAAHLDHMPLLHTAARTRATEQLGLHQRQLQYNSVKWYS